MDDGARPILFLDVDGVISLFGFDLKGGSGPEPPGPFHFIDGIPHCIGTGTGPLIGRLHEVFDIVWATGWEEKANEYLPHLLGIPDLELPVLSFDGRAVFGSAHWKIEVIDAYAGERPAAWIDDNLDDECEAWATGRLAPTLLVRTIPSIGLTDEHVDLLLEWAKEPAGR
jgi:hypothetical protein